jgi:hypothetical protein
MQSIAAAITAGHTSTDSIPRPMRAFLRAGTTSAMPGGIDHVQLLSELGSSAVASDGNVPLESATK